MKAKELIKAFEKAKKRIHFIGTMEAGAIIALDLEGRIYTLLDGTVMNRVNTAAIEGQSTRDGYLNPGGDGLWPAPEGTSMGYNYATGSWRVSPGLSNARYNITDYGVNFATAKAEIDLINGQGIGIPTIFSRSTQIVVDDNSITLKTEECIQYIGARPISSKDAMIAPWTLSQFDCDDGCEVIFPCENVDYVWDLYEDKIGKSGMLGNKTYKAIANGSQRYQIAMGPQVPWIELHIPNRGLRVHREAQVIPADQNYIDISDAAPNLSPASKGVRYSVYSDTANFMEIEAAGGAPDLLTSDTKLKLQVTTKFQLS